MSRSGARCVELRVELLGPLRLVVEGAVVDVPGRKRRTVLALLALAQGRTVAVDQLLDAVWPDDPPEATRAAVHSHISRLRGHLGPAAEQLERVPGGYRLVGAGTDVVQARALLAAAREADDPAAAGALLRQARALWRGGALADLVDMPAWSVTLTELHCEIGDQLVSYLIDAGEVGEVVSLATGALAEEPLREPAVLLLMRALAATGRAPDALRAGREYRRRLTAETGLDPTPALGELEHQIAASYQVTPGEHRRASALPQPATPLIGRDSEVAALRRLVAHERLITVAGPGGMGKTRLALEVARHVRDTIIVPLAPVTDPAALPHALAAALDLHVRHGDVLAACVALLSAGPRLLLVDNCEHLLDAVRDVVNALLGGCLELTVLATSREPLGLAAECISRLAPLPLPPKNDRLALDRAPAVVLFTDRARRVRAGFAPDARELGVVADIVRRLDGMPLAIELAAGRLSSLDLHDLHARLDRSLDLLGASRSAGAADARHRTLRATIEWSYALLPGDERRLFRHLAVFPDGVDLATAERVARELSVLGDPASALAHLVDASMIEFDVAGGARYRMLEMLRTFGIDRLVAEHEDASAVARLLRWAVDLASWVEATVIGEREPEADMVLRREVPNLRAAWRLIREQGRLDDAVTLVIALADAAGWRDLTEVWSWSRELVTDPALPQHPRYVAVLGVAAMTSWLRGDLNGADALARRGLGIASDDEDRYWCLTAQAEVELSRGGYPAAIQRGLHAAGLGAWPIESLSVAAVAAVYAGKLDQARAIRDRLAQVAASPTGAALARYIAGEIESAAASPDQARAHYAEAIDLAREGGATFVIGISSVGLLCVQAAAGRVDDALRGYREVIGYWERTGSWIQQWTTLRNLAQLLSVLGDHEPALFLDVAADHAPEASAVTDAVRKPSAVSPELSEETASRIRARAGGCARSVALHVARQAIDRHLSL